MTPGDMKALRQRLGRLTQREFGALLGRSHRQIAGYETGTTKIPRVIALSCQSLEQNAGSRCSLDGGCVFSDRCGPTGCRDIEAP